MLSEQDTLSLIWLQWHWDSHYAIQVRDGLWMARRLDHPLVTGDGQSEIITAGSAPELRDKLKDDYAELAMLGSKARIGPAEGGSRLPFCCGAEGPGHDPRALPPPGRRRGCRVPGPQVSGGRGRLRRSQGAPGRGHPALDRAGVSRHAELRSDPAGLRAILASGAIRARMSAAATLDAVRAATGLGWG